MARVSRMIVVASTLSVLSGCAGPKWYRAIGSIPGVAWTDYAFTFYCDTATQLYPAAPGQIESSVQEALADLGYRDVALPERTDGASLIRCKAPDGRHVRVTVTPQNAMTMVAVAISPPIGDYQPSRDLLRRVALNFGTGMRAFTPVDTTLPRRINPPSMLSRPAPPPPPEALQGEGLRPDVRQEALRPDEITVPGSVIPPYMTVPGALGVGGFVPTMAFPNPPNVPYAPWPYVKPYSDAQ
jgi:hypothetical protein